MNCLDCGKPVNPDGEGVGVECLVWMFKRKGGGGNRRDLRPTGRLLCRDCGKLRDLGVTPGQQRLIDNPDL